VPNLPGISSPQGKSFHGTAQDPRRDHRPPTAGGWLGGRLTARVSKGMVRRVAGALIAASGVPLIVGAVLGS
jgi:hypothetical protein